MNINSNSTNKIEYLVKTDNNPHHKVYHVAHGLDALKDYFDDFIIRLVSRSALKTDHKIDQIKARLQNISWKAKGWKKAKGEIANLDIVKPLFELYERSNANLQWLKGHNGHEFNEMADEWANKARAGETL